MASYRLEWRRSATIDLRRIAAVDVPRVMSAAEALAEDPFPPGCTKLSGSERSYRIRVGDYRILFDVLSGHLLIEVVKVGNRKDVIQEITANQRLEGMPGERSRSSPQPLARRPSA
jgi:mRNA interferase RelE/StbE